MADMTESTSGNGPGTGPGTSRTGEPGNNKSGSKTGLIVTIVILVLVILAGAVLAILAATGFFAADDEPIAVETPTAEPTETVDPEPVVVGYETPRTWCTALRNTPIDEFANSPSWIWAAFVLATDDGGVAEEGTVLELLVPGSDLDPVEAQVMADGVVEVIVPVSSFGIYEIAEISEARGDRTVPGRFIDVQVSETEFGPECSGPSELALDNLILESELFEPAN